MIGLVLGVYLAAGASLLTAILRPSKHDLIGFAAALAFVALWPLGVATREFFKAKHKRERARARKAASLLNNGT